MVKLLNEIENICAKMNWHSKQEQLILEMFKIRDYNGGDKEYMQNFGGK